MPAAAPLPGRRDRWRAGFRAPVLALALPMYDVLIVHRRRYRSGLTPIRDLPASMGKNYPGAARRCP